MPEIKNYPSSMCVNFKDSHKERDYIISIKLNVFVPKNMLIDEVVHNIESLIEKERDIEREGGIIEIEVVETSVVY